MNTSSSLRVAVFFRAATVLILLSASFGIFGAATNVYGPKAYVGPPGAPRIQSDTFPAPPTDACSAKTTFVLTISNGDAAGNRRVSAAVISLNGAQIFGESDFNQNVAQLTAPVQLLPVNSLTVDLRGAPDETLTIAVVREIDEPLYPAKVFTLTQTQQTFTDTLHVGSISGSFTLTMTTGNAGGLQRVKKAAVRLNGVKIAALSNKAPVVRVPVSLQPDTSIALDAQGSAGDVVTLAISRHGDPAACSLSTITIDTPAEGEAIHRFPMVVTGKASGPVAMGISVNGFAASIDLNHQGTVADPYSWIAVVHSFSAEGGVNAVLTEPSGNTVSALRSLTFSAAPSPLIVRAEPSNGIAPLSTSFVVLPGEDAASTPRTFNVDFEGDGVYEISGAAELPESLTHTYSDPGLYRMKIQISSGGVLTDVEAPVAVQTFKAVDGAIQQRWRDLRAALARKDIEAAVRLFTDASQAKYRGVFTTLSDRLPAIAAAMPASVASITLNGDTAEYLVPRTEEGRRAAYRLSLIRDGDGLWKIADF